MATKLIRPDKDSVDVPKEIPVVLVTPEQAQEWLDSRFDNERPLHRNKVIAFARDMKEDNWHFTGDTVRFDSATGNLMDGQHRLAAIVASGTAQWFPVLNVPQEARAGIDTGSARTLGELLHMGNHVHGRILAAIVRRVLIYRNGLQATSGGRYLPTHTEGIRFVEENEPLLRKASLVANKAQSVGVPMSPSAIGSAYFLCAKVDEKQADEVFERLVTGLGLTEGDPVTALRNRAIKYVERNRTNMVPDDVFRFSIVVWNYIRGGTKITRLMMPREGWTNRNVPIPE